MEETKEQTEEVKQGQLPEGEDYQIDFLKFIDKGSFGEVWFGRIMGSDESKTKYAAIKVEIESSAETDLHQEFLTMKAIGKHEHIIEFLECAKEINRYFNENFFGRTTRITYLALEYAPNGNLLTYLNGKEKVEEKWVRYWFRQILAGLKHIKSRGFSHLDIKCENILLDGDLNIKICDFTFSRLNDRRINNYCGSEWYRAPEICRKHPFDGEKADVFALAVVLFACMMRSFPASEKYNVTDSPKYQLFCARNQQYQWPKEPQVSEDFKDLFNKMFKEDPEQRISLKEIRNHSWVTNCDLPSDVELNEEKRRLESIREGKINEWIEYKPHSQSFIDIEEVFRSADYTEKIQIDSRLDETKVQKHRLEATHYHPGLFQWTHFRSSTSTDDDNLCLLLIVEAILNKVNYDTQLVEPKEGQNNLSIKFWKKLDDTDATMKSSVIKGEFTIYTDEKVKGQLWAIFKQTQGNQFLFKSLFDEIISYDQIRDDFIENDV